MTEVKSDKILFIEILKTYNGFEYEGKIVVDYKIVTRILLNYLGQS